LAAVDMRKTDAVDVQHDLSVYPWPFEDEQFENGLAQDIIEHMLHVIPFMDECWRIIKPGGKLLIRTTYFESEQSYKDPTHFHFFTLDSFDFFDPETDTGKAYLWYTDKKWKVDRRAIDGQEAIFHLTKR
jgi:SAM-dependent methyltransferase